MNNNDNLHKIIDFIPNDSYLAEIEKTLLQSSGSSSQRQYILLSKSSSKANPQYNFRPATEEEFTNHTTSPEEPNTTLGRAKKTMSTVLHSLLPHQTECIVPLDDLKKFIELRNFSCELPAEMPKKAGVIKHDDYAFPSWMANSTYYGEVDYILTSATSGSIARPQGYGVLTFQNNREYTGNFVNGKPHGNGTFKPPYSSPNSYITFTSDSFTFNSNEICSEHAEGKLNGQVVYVGGMRDGTFHGKGKYTAPDGSVYGGDWVNGKRHGYGTITFPNGDGFTGQWVSDGYGSRTTESNYQFRTYNYHGEKQTDDIYVIDERHGTYRHTYPRGNAYEGQWINAHYFNGQNSDWGYDMYIDVVGPYGRGKITCSNGDVIEGFFHYSTAPGISPHPTWTGTIRYANGLTAEVYNPIYFDPETVSGNLEFLGKLTLASGLVFQGKIKNGEPVGPGTLSELQPDQSVKRSMPATFENGQPNEFGQLVFGKNDPAGSWLENLSWAGNVNIAVDAMGVAHINPEGTHNLVFPNGALMECTFVNGAIQNISDTVKLPNGNIYKRTAPWTFSDKLECADGVIYGSDGRLIYKGGFSQGDLSGKGTYHFPNGDIYRGQFANGLPNGQGTLETNEGTRYDGEFVNGKKEGQGKLSILEKSYDGSLVLVVYEGGWKNDKRDGYGTQTYANGDRYEGDWQGNKQDGFGTIIYSNGDRYRGNWREDLREGEGMMEYGNNNGRYNGAWSDNTYNGFGRRTNPDGTIDVGTWVNGAPTVGVHISVSGVETPYNFSPPRSSIS